MEFGDIYDKLVEFGGAGALLPITSFGHSLAHAAYEGAKTDGLLGLSSNIFECIICTTLSFKDRNSNVLYKICWSK